MTTETLTTTLYDHAKQMDKKGKKSAAWAFRTAAKLTRKHLGANADEWDRDRQPDECPGCHQIGELADPPDLYHCTTNEDECGVAVFKEPTND